MIHRPTPTLSVYRKEYAPPYEFYGSKEKGSTDIYRETDTDRHVNTYTDIHRQTHRNAYTYIDRSRQTYRHTYIVGWSTDTW